jgi:hypothetical protein
MAETVPEGEARVRSRNPWDWVWLLLATGIPLAGSAVMANVLLKSVARDGLKVGVVTVALLGVGLASVASG